MNFETATFYFFAAILVYAALRVITVRNPVYAALHLVLAFFTAAAIWLLARAEFLAIALVLVYVGAVMVLFLFVVMMLDINIDRLREGFWRYLPAAAVIGALMLAEIVVMIVVYSGFERVPEPSEPAAGYSNIKELGRLLYTDYVYPFELAAVILLVAIIAAIALTLRRRKDTKYLNPAEQVAVQRKDRIRVVSMPAERGE